MKIRHADVLLYKKDRIEIPDCVEAAAVPIHSSVNSCIFLAITKSAPLQFKFPKSRSNNLRIRLIVEDLQNNALLPFKQLVLCDWQLVVDWLFPSPPAASVYVIPMSTLDQHGFTASNATGHMEYVGAVPVLRGEAMATGTFLHFVGSQLVEIQIAFHRSLLDHYQPLPILNNPPKAKNTFYGFVQYHRKYLQNAFLFENRHMDDFLERLALGSKGSRMKIELQRDGLGWDFKCLAYLSQLYVEIAKEVLHLLKGRSIDAVRKEHHECKKRVQLKCQEVFSCISAVYNADLALSWWDRRVLRFGSVYILGRMASSRHFFVDAYSMMSRLLQHAMDMCSLHLNHVLMRTIFPVLCGFQHHWLAYKETPRRTPTSVGFDSGPRNYTSVSGKPVIALAMPSRLTQLAISDGAIVEAMTVSDAGSQYAYWARTDEFMTDPESSPPCMNIADNQIHPWLNWGYVRHSQTLVDDIAGCGCAKGALFSSMVLYLSRAEYLNLIVNDLQSALSELQVSTRLLWCLSFMKQLKWAHIVFSDLEQIALAKSLSLVAEDEKNIKKVDKKKKTKKTSATKKGKANGKEQQQAARREPSQETAKAQSVSSEEEEEVTYNSFMGGMVIRPWAGIADMKLDDGDVVVEEPSTRTKARAARGSKLSVGEVIPEEEMVVETGHMPDKPSDTTERSVVMEPQTPGQQPQDRFRHPSHPPTTNIRTKVQRFNTPPFPPPQVPVQEVLPYERYRAWSPPKKPIPRVPNRHYNRLPPPHASIPTRPSYSVPHSRHHTNIPPANSPAGPVGQSKAPVPVASMPFPAWTTSPPLANSLGVTNHSSFTTTSIFHVPQDFPSLPTRNSSLSGSSHQGIIHPSHEEPHSTMHEPTFKTSNTDTQDTSSEDRAQQQLCLVCKDNVSCVLLMNCAHLVTCEDCSTSCMWCPLCNARVAHMVKVYIP
mmetsp:Transcript_47435/g.78982  ORF Transcript_47435/g.78982 Transcript_47435/m.78982 type:complete len:938 (+) Transcript_47435:192-3005(+)